MRTKVSDTAEKVLVGGLIIMKVVKILQNEDMPIGYSESWARLKKALYIAD